MNLTATGYESDWTATGIWPWFVHDWNLEYDRDWNLNTEGYWGAQGTLRKWEFSWRTAPSFKFSCAPKRSLRWKTEKSTGIIWPAISKMPTEITRRSRASAPTESRMPSALTKTTGFAVQLSKAIIMSPFYDVRMKREEARRCCQLIESSNQHRIFLPTFKQRYEWPSTQKKLGRIAETNWRLLQLIFGKLLPPPQDQNADQLLQDEGSGVLSPDTPPSSPPPPTQ